jgi:hypothetical protein
MLSLISILDLLLFLLTNITLAGFVMQVYLRQALHTSLIHKAASLPIVSTVERMFHNNSPESIIIHSYVKYKLKNEFYSNKIIKFTQSNLKLET